MFRFRLNHLQGASGTSKKNNNKPTALVYYQHVHGLCVARLLVGGIGTV
jgi:hypothetical protein